MNAQLIVSEPPGPPHTDPHASPRTRELAAALDSTLRDGAPADLPARIAATLAGFLHHQDLLSTRHLRSDPRHYRQHVLHVAPDGAFSLVALVWLPGQTTPIHDHTTWCVVGIHLGVEEETSYRFETRVSGPVLVPVATTVNPVGTVTRLTPPGDIHVVCNAGTETAVSLHVYGTDVRLHGTSIRRRYDIPSSTPACEDLRP